MILNDKLQDISDQMCQFLPFFMNWLKCFHTLFMLKPFFKILAKQKNGKESNCCQFDFT